ncbi:MAG: hypothetical protein COZ05_01230 [Armatimonadetes bacterium CG_4_10_14_3_um_filter_59_10]|nr:MAG: hypothetical protein COZ05_01230 [Armatimonadetes bacterium CG_4_10_14_3_um_filter_59_10]
MIAEEVASHPQSVPRNARQEFTTIAPLRLPCVDGASHDLNHGSIRARIIALPWELTKRMQDAAGVNQGTMTLGRYVLKRVIGRGGMGIVYAGEDPSIGRPVAVKTLRVDDSLSDVAQQTIRDLFRREARAAGNLSHPNIVTIYSVESTDKTDFIVMEFVDGPSLKQALQQGGALGVDRAIRLTRQLCSALSHAHGKGVVHGDLKPANIFLAGPDTCKLGDFGIARISFEANAAFEANVEPGQVQFGSLGYMSPEQMSRQPMDARSDVFSLAVTFAEALSGIPMFKDLDREQIRSLLERKTYQTPRGLPPEFEQLWVKALDVEPQARHQSAAEFASALEIAESALTAESEGLRKRDSAEQKKVRILSKARCAYHPTAMPMDLCVACGRPICVACVRPSPEGTLCYRCAPVNRSNSPQARLSCLLANNALYYAVAGGLVALIVLVWLLTR